MPFDYIPPLLRTSSSKIVLLVMDGFGGIPISAGGPTALEAARTPNMDHLASEGALGQVTPIRPGITPGSGPAHLALFGYDPLEYEIGRGVLESVGVGLQVRLGDVAARGNFCTLDEHGNITDRPSIPISMTPTPNEQAFPRSLRQHVPQQPGTPQIYLTSGYQRLVKNWLTTKKLMG
jgi:2,3-bisphosphoglycerate-independent phosphoglycerate mutase